MTLEGPPEPPAPDPDPDAEIEKEAKEARIAVATTLATGVTVLVAALGLFGGLTGAVARMARNYPQEAGLAIGAVILSVALAIVARLVAPGKGDKKPPGLLVKPERRPYWSTALLWVSAFLFTAGVILAVILLTATIDKDDRPSVSAQSTRDSATGAVSLAGTAKAGGLAAEDALRVVVVSFEEGQTTEGTQLYYAVVGPNPDGVVDHAFTVLLPTGARSVVMTAGNDAADTKGVPASCKPDDRVDKPVSPASPVVVKSDSGKLTACALVAVPLPPPTGSPNPSPSPAPGAAPSLNP